MATELVQLTKSLQNAIRSGDEVSAKALVQKLTLMKAPVVVNLEEATLPSTSIRLRVMFEDRTVSGPSIDLHVNPQATIGAVKCLIYDKLKFPPEVQRCIVGKRMRHNKETLASCGLTYDGCILFLYILSAETVGLQLADETQDSDISLQAFQNSDHTSHPLSLVDSINQIHNLGPGIAPHLAVEHVIAAASFSPNATISSPHAPAVTDHHAVLGGGTDAASSPAPAAEEGNVQQIDLSHSMSSADQRGGGDDVDAAVAAAAENKPAEEAPWSCVVCTYLNHGCMMMCELCSSQRPGVAADDLQDITDDEWVDEGPQQMNTNDAEYDGPDWINGPEWNNGRKWNNGPGWINGPLPLQDTRKLTNSYNDLLQMEQCHVVANCDSFNCPICLDSCEPGHGVVLRECLHMFCSHCLEEHVRLADSATVKCPFNNGDYACSSTILDREIKALVSPETYQKYLQRSLQEAECRTPNSYHCATPNCTGWCTFEDDVNSFFCYACSHDNCLTCRAIHEDMNCADHQRQMKAKFQTDHAARMAQASLEELLKFGEALKCPTCGIIIMKKEGCDWIQCTMCKTEICWVTRQARWGPKGAGDNSGGCRCRVNGKPCHPDCQNCH